VLAEYNQVTQQANQVASQPLNQYGGQIVAGTTPEEQSAYNTIDNMQGITAPYTQQASNLLGQASQTINPQTVTGSQIQSYESPYTQSVLNTTMAAENNQDAQQQAQLQGNAISSGAWGGDRSAVAQGILGGQQALANNATNAGIENAGYTTAEQEANTEQQAGLGAQEASQYLQESAGLGENQLGTSALSNGLTGASAQLNAGQLQQQQAQAELNVPYEQFLQEQAYPFQTTGWLGNIAEGIGSNEGGSSTSSTTQPSEGLFKRGGGITGKKHYDSGGAASYTYDPESGTYFNNASPGSVGVYSAGDIPSGATVNTPNGVGWSGDLPADLQPQAAATAPTAAAAPASISMPTAPTYAQFLASGAGNSGKAYTGGIVAGLNSANQADLNNIYSAKAAKGGGIIPKRDAGGVTPFTQTTNPLQNNQTSNYSQMTLQQLQQLAQRLPPGTPQGQAVQAALKQKEYMPNVGSGAMARGGIVPKHFDAGGSDDSNSGGIMPAIAQVESGNNPDAVSPAGAFSAYGIMPATAADPGYGVTPYQGPGDERRFASDYHNAMLNHFNGDENMALMAYNGGPGRLDNVANGNSSVSDLPSETQAYPDKVMAAMGDGQTSAKNDNMPPPTPPTNAPDHPANTSGYLEDMPQPHQANPWLSVAAGVLGTLAGRSRNPLVDIGQGGLIGINNYAEQQKNADQENYQQGSFHQNAQKLMDEAENTKNQFGEEKLKDANQAQYQQGELGVRQQELQQNRNEVIKDMFGNPTGTFNKTTGKFIPMDFTGNSGGAGAQGAQSNSAPKDVDGTPLTPFQMYAYKNLITKQQPKDIAAENMVLPSLIDQKSKVDDLVNQIPTASSGDMHTLKDFADRNQLPVFSDPDRAKATVLQNYDSMGNVLDNIRSTFGGTGRVLSKEFEGLQNELSVNKSASPEQKAVVVAHIQSKLNDLIQNETQRAQDIHSGKAYLPSYQSPEQQRLAKIPTQSSSAASAPSTVIRYDANGNRIQ
jgi:hypothetical protein